MIKISVAALCIPGITKTRPHSEGTDMQNDLSGVVWFNGELTDFSSGRTSIEDRGFLFGDGVYEVVRVYDGRPFALAEHLARLQSSAAGIELELPVSTESLTTIAQDVLNGT